MQNTLSRLRAKKDDDGFTLIELLVVVVIIGVLVAIAVPVYLNYRQGAADKSAQSDVRGAVSTVEQYYTNNGNKYPANFGPTAGTGGKYTIPKLTNGTDGVISLSDSTQIQLKNNVSSYVLCGYNTNGTTNKFYVYNGGTTGASSVKASTATTLALCISTGK